jgi:hypothetical protein
VQHSKTGCVDRQLSTAVIAVSNVTAHAYPAITTASTFASNGGSLAELAYGHAHHWTELPVDNAFSAADHHTA